MQQIRITRTSDLDSVLSFLKRRYPLLSEAEIIKMALSNQYYQEEQMGRERLQDPTQRFTKAEWKKKFAVFEQIRERITPEDEEHLDEAIDRAVREVRAKKNKTYEHTSS
jgi:Skp family chaperone for outer membrane proteins